MVKVHIQNAVPALLVHRRWEHCVVQHRVQKLIEITIVVMFIEGHKFISFLTAKCHPPNKV